LFPAGGSEKMILAQFGEWAKRSVRCGGPGAGKATAFHAFFPPAVRPHLWHRLCDLIRNWLRNRNTIEFLGIWEHLNNPGFKPVEFDGFRKLAGLNSFTLTPKQWIEKTGAIGIIPKAGRYGGTYAHKDIAFEFVFFLAAWKLLLEVVLVP